MANLVLLNDLIDQSGMTKTFIAKRLNITRQGLYKKLIGKSDFAAREVQMLCDLLRITEPKEMTKVFFDN